MTDGEKRDIWRLTLENVSACMKPEEAEKEQNMYKDVSQFPLEPKQTVLFFIALVQLSDVSPVCSCTLDTRITSVAWLDKTLKW